MLLTPEIAIGNRVHDRSMLVDETLDRVCLASTETELTRDRGYFDTEVLTTRETTIEVILVRHSWSIVRTRSSRIGWSSSIGSSSKWRVPTTEDGTEIIPESSIVEIVHADCTSRHTTDLADSEACERARTSGVDTWR